MPLYFQVVHKLSASDAGLALIPIVVMTTPGSMLSGRAMMYLTPLQDLGLSAAPSRRSWRPPRW